MASPEASSKPNTAKPADEIENEDPQDIEIAVRAYHLWESRGRPHGSHQEDWFNAEQELKNQGRRYPGVAVS